MPTSHIMDLETWPSTGVFRSEHNTHTHTHTHSSLASRPRRRGGDRAEPRSRQERAKVQLSPSVSSFVPRVYIRAKPSKDLSR